MTQINKSVREHFETFVQMNGFIIQLDTNKNTYVFVLYRNIFVLMFAVILSGLITTQIEHFQHN